MLKKKNTKFLSDFGIQTSPGVGEVNKPPRKWMCADMFCCRLSGDGDVRICTCVCVCVRRWAAKRNRSQKILGPMPDEIMNLSNSILGKCGVMVVVGREAGG